MRELLLPEGYGIEIELVPKSGEVRRMRAVPLHRASSSSARVGVYVDGRPYTICIDGKHVRIDDPRWVAMMEEIVRVFMDEFRTRVAEKSEIRESREVRARLRQRPVVIERNG